LAQSDHREEKHGGNDNDNSDDGGNNTRRTHALPTAALHSSLCRSISFFVLYLFENLFYFIFVRPRYHEKAAFWPARAEARAPPRAPHTGPMTAVPLWSSSFFFCFLLLFSE
jgi:hypothetical protein